MKRSRRIVFCFALALRLLPANLCLAQSIQFDASVSGAVQAQMNLDLKFMGAITGDRASPLHEQIFGKVNGSDYLNWFSKRVQSVGTSDCYSSLALACQDGEQANRILLTPLYSQSEYPQIVRLLIIFHEARHTEVENDHWLHANCPRHFAGISLVTGASLAWQPACDITEYGSYGAGAILLHNIGQFCTNCSDKVKADAELYAQDNLQRLIDAGALERTKQDFQFH